MPHSPAAATGTRGEELPSGGDAVPRRRQLQRLLAARCRRSSCCSSTASMTRARTGDPPRPGRQPHLSLLARLRARREGGPALRLPRRTGRSSPSGGLRFDPAKVLLDPYGRAVVVPEGLRPRGAAPRPGDNAATAMKSVVVDPRPTTGRATSRCGARPRSTIIYELHVRGFTRHPTSGVGDDTPAPSPGLVEKIPYLKELGRHRRRAAAGPRVRRAGLPAGRGQLLGLQQPVAFFAPHRPTARASDPLGAGRRVPRHGQGAAPRPASRSSSTSSSTTPARATTAARRSPSAAWTTPSTTCSTRDRRATSTSPAAATRSTATTRSSAT